MGTDSNSIIDIINSVYDKDTNTIRVNSDVTKIEGYYYWQDPENQLENDWRAYSNGIYLDFERYDGSIWVQQFRMGGSASVSDYIEIIKNPNADLLVNDDGSIRNIIRSNIWDSGTTVGDIVDNTIIMTKDSITKGYPIEAESWKIIQSDYSQYSTGKSFYSDVTTLDADGFISRKAKVKLGVATTQTVAQVKIYKATDLVNPIWQNISDVELTCECKDNFDPTTGIITFEPIFYGYGNEDVRIEVNFIEDVTLLGSTIDATDIYFESFDATLALESINTANIFGSEFEVFESLAESTAGTTWTDKVDATTASKPAGKYRIGFQCEITETGASEEVRFLVNSVVIHNHTTGNDELEPNLEEDNWTTISGLHYITLTEASAIDINIQHKDSGYGKMSNAIIEIWRVS